MATAEDQGDVERLVLALKHEDSNLRSSAAKALVHVGDDRCSEPLAEALINDKEWVVRRWAAEALGNIGGSQVVGPLTTAHANDPFVCEVTGRRVVRITAEEALAKLEKAETATEPLERVLACQWSQPSPSDHVSAQVKALTRYSNSIADTDVSKCLACIGELAVGDHSISSEAMCYAVLAANHYKVRQAAAIALKDRDAPEMTKVIVDALDYSEERSSLVRNALEALAVIEDPSTTEPISRFLRDFVAAGTCKPGAGHSDAFAVAAGLDVGKGICLSASRALAVLGGREAIQAMESVLSDECWGQLPEIRKELPDLIAEAKLR